MRMGVTFVQATTPVKRYGSISTSEQLRSTLAETKFVDPEHIRGGPFEPQLHSSVDL